MIALLRGRFQPSRFCVCLAATAPLLRVAFLVDEGGAILFPFLQE